MSVSLSLGMDPFAPAVLCGNVVATCTQDRRLWIWIWMGNLISTASLSIAPDRGASAFVIQVCLVDTDTRRHVKAYVPQ